jgi:hypothetical protein
MMAMTLVEIGLGLSGVVTKLNLEAAIEHLDEMAQLEAEADIDGGDQPGNGGGAWTSGE